jgi:hypothetical protein
MSAIIYSLLALGLVWSDMGSSQCLRAIYAFANYTMLPYPYNLGAFAIARVALPFLQMILSGVVLMVTMVVAAPRLAVAMGCSVVIIAVAAVSLWHGMHHS